MLMNLNSIIDGVEQCICFRRDDAEEIFKLYKTKQKEEKRRLEKKKTPSQKKEAKRLRENKIKVSRERKTER